MKRTIIILVIAACFVISTRGQGFLNLNFESAYNLPASPENGVSVSITNALPDWTAYGSGGDVLLSEVEYVSNNFTGTVTPVELEGGTLALSGNFSVGLYPNGSISQMGLVPDNAESLQFEADISGNPLSVTLGGQRLSYSALSEGPDYTVYGANIPSDLDGQTEALTFLNLDPSGSALLDNIEFLPTSVPEPGEFALVGLGAILLGIGHWRKLGKR